MIRDPNDDTDYGGGDDDDESVFLGPSDFSEAGDDERKRSVSGVYMMILDPLSSTPPVQSIPVTVLQSYVLPECPMSSVAGPQQAMPRMRPRASHLRFHTARR